MEQSLRLQADRRLPTFMAYNALAFLLLAAVVHPHTVEGQRLPEWMEILAWSGLGITYLAAVVEFGLRQVLVERGGGWRRLAYRGLCLLLPPLHLGLQPLTMPGRVFVPLVGWRKVGRHLARELERRFSGPMIAVALLILPVLALELIWSARVEATPWLAHTLDVAVRLIWLAFAVELAVLIAASSEKLGHAIKHWVDVAVVVLPFVAFLRMLRVIRAGQILRAQRVTQLARTYRLRGVGVRLFRALLLLKVAERMSVTVARKRLEMLRGSVRKKHQEIEDLEHEIAEIEARLAEAKTAKARVADDEARAAAAAIAPDPSAKA